MEKPAVVFSEKGWENFLAFLSSREGENNNIENIQEVGESELVTKFVEDYHKHKETEAVSGAEPEVKQRRKRQSPEYYARMDNMILRALRDAGEPLSGADLRRFLNGLGFGIKPKSFSGTMNQVMKRQPGIQRVGRSLYQLVEGGVHAYE